MTVYAPYDPTSLFAGDFPARHRSLTVASGSNASGTLLARGTVLGTITATSKLTIAVAAATDGSQVPVGVLACDIDTSAGDVVAPVYCTGEFADLEMTFGAGHTPATVDAAFQASGRSIFVRSVGSVA